MSATRWGLLGLLMVFIIVAATYAGVFRDDTVMSEREIDVIMTDFTFIPGIIKLSAGVPVKMTVTNEGRLPHDFVVTGLGVDVATRLLEPGESETLTFTPENSGRLEMYCSVPGHREMGLTTGGQVE